MRRLAMLLSVVVVLLGSAGVPARPSASAQEATPAGQTRPAQPAQPEAGPGGAETAFPAARAVKYGPDPGGFWIWEPTTAEGEAPDGGPFPVVFYPPRRTPSVAGEEARTHHCAQIALMRVTLVEPATIIVRLATPIRPASGC